MSRRADRRDYYLETRERAGHGALKIYREYSHDEAISIYDGNIAALIAARIAVEGYGNTLDYLLHTMAEWSPWPSNGVTLAVNNDPIMPKAGPSQGPFAA